MAMGLSLYPFSAATAEGCTSFPAFGSATSCWQLEIGSDTTVSKCHKPPPWRAGCWIALSSPPPNNLWGSELSLHTRVSLHHYHHHPHHRNCLSLPCGKVKTHTATRYTETRRPGRSKGWAGSHSEAPEAREVPQSSWAVAVELEKRAGSTLMGDNPRDCSQSGQSKLHDKISSTVPLTQNQTEWECRHVLVCALNASEKHTGKYSHESLWRRGMRWLGHCGGKRFSPEIPLFSERHSLCAHSPFQSNKRAFLNNLPA